MNRKKSNRLIGILLPTLSGFGKSKRFTPDVLIDQDYDLSQHGLEASVIPLPGHSKGSIGILTIEGDLFCGDLFENTKKPCLNSIMDDPTAAHASLASLKDMEIRMVYPGHGQPFAWEGQIG